MKKLALTLGLAAMNLAGPASVLAQCTSPTSAESPPQTHPIVAIRYPQGETISVKLRGTYRLPRANGEAKVERKRGSTEIEIELDEMKAATHFGGDYNTYILWTVSPEGLVAKAGEFILEGNRSKLNVSSPLDTFGMIVSAEPHYAVATPSRFMVLENVQPKSSKVTTETAALSLSTSASHYRHERETLKDAPESGGRVRTEWRQAQTAIQLAERAGAGQFAAGELQRARDALQEGSVSQEGRRPSKESLRKARYAVRLAAQAEQLAKARSFEATLAEERKERAAELARLEQALRSATTQAERAQLEVQKSTLELQMEAEARQKAEQQVAALRLEQEALLAEKQAQTEAANAEKQHAAGREQLREALGAVAAISETDQGLVVTLPDSLFEPKRADLKPEAQDVLQRIAAALRAAQPLEISIEGHTDDAGSQERNMEFARERAYAVSAQLAKAGVPSDSMVLTSFGETAPLVPNSSAANRRLNRRVEIVISGWVPASAQRP